MLIAVGATEILRRHPAGTQPPPAEATLGPWRIVFVELVSVENTALLTDQNGMTSGSCGQLLMYGSRLCMGGNGAVAT